MADTKLELLRRVPLFSGLDRSGLGQVAKLADEVEVAPGAVLTREGETGHEFFVVVDGRVRVEQGGQLVNTLAAGDFLGEISLVDGGPRSATATSEGPARLLVIGHREFHSLMAGFPRIQLQILQALAERVRRVERNPVH